MEVPVRQLGEYEVLARLSRGGMAELFLARRHGAAGFTRLVVVKRILPQLARDSEFVRMFLEEARLAARIHHTNVVQILDLGEERGDYFIVMELIAGCSSAALLRHVAETGAPIPWAVAAEIVAQTCDGLEAAHELRDDAGNPLDLVHRDVSPGNLMLAKDGVVKLVDFGIAKAQDSAVKTATGTFKGKYPYMSPEACQGNPVDRRTDIFSLGVTFYELVTGERIFDRGNPTKSIFAVLYDTVPDPRERREDLPAPLSRVILRAMERNPASRYQRALELGAALRAALEQLGARTSPRQLAEYLQRSCAPLLQRQTRAIERIIEQTVVEQETRETQETKPDEPAATPRPGTAAPALHDAPTGPARRPRRRLGLLLVLMAIFVAAVGVGWLVRRLLTPAPPLRLGLAPSFTHRAVSAELGPFVRYLEEELGREIELVVDRSYDELRSGLVQGDLDLAALPHIQVLHARRSLVPPRILAAMRHRGSTTYRSLLVVRDNSAVRTPAALRSRSMCWVSRSSASGYLVPRLRLRDAGLDPDRDLGAVRFSGSHLAALRDLLAGRCEAAATSHGWLLLGAKHGVEVERIKVLAEAGRIPLDHIGVKRQLDLSLQEELRRALLDFDARRHIDRAVIGPHFMADGFAAPRPADFATLRRALRQERILP